jgi:DNA-binding NtrC family response regulator
MSTEQTRVLVIDEDRSFLAELESSLSQECEVKTADNTKDAHLVFQTFKPNTVILDVSVARDSSFVDFFSSIRREDRNVIRIVTSSDYTNLENIMDAINRAHVHKYLKKPIDMNVLRSTLRETSFDYHETKSRYADEEKGEAYDKLKTVLDTAKQAKQLQLDADSKLEHVADIETERRRHAAHVKELETRIEAIGKESDDLEIKWRGNVGKVKEERDGFRDDLEKSNLEIQRLKREVKREMDSRTQQVAEVESEAKGQVNQVEELREHVERLKSDSEDAQHIRQREIEQEMHTRDSIRDDFERVKAELSQVKEERDFIEMTLRELKIVAEAKKESLLEVTEEFIRINRFRKNGMDSVLFVDKEDNNLENMKNMFGKNYNVYTAKNPDEAIKLVSRNADICVVITDYQISSGNGIDLADRVKKTNLDLPVFLLSGRNDYELVKKAINSGVVTRFIEKPLRREVMLEAIKAGTDIYDRSAGRSGILDKKKTFVIDAMQAMKEQMKRMEFQVADERKEMLLKLDDERSALDSEVSERRVVLDVELSEVESEFSKKREEQHEAFEAQREEQRQHFADLAEQKEKEKQEMMAKIAADQQKAKDDMEAERARFEQEMKEHQEKMDIDLKKKTEEFEQIAKRKEEEQGNIIDKIEKEQKDLREQVDKEKKELREQMEKDKKEHYDKMKKEKDEFADEKKRLLDDMKADLKKKTDDVEQKLKDQTERFEDDQKRSKEDMEDQIKRSKEELEDERKRMEKDNNERKQATVTELETVQKAFHQEVARKRAELDKAIELEKQKAQAQSGALAELQMKYDMLVESREALEAELASR